jgi:hypothetical protein
MTGLRVTPITLTEANEYVARHHRHHKPTVGHLFSVAAAVGDDVCGVAIVGRPVARELQDGYTAEVLRVATDGTANACSMLYATCWRAARALGYQRLGTYTLASEPGTSLRAAGWRIVGETSGRSWDAPGRPRVDWHPTLTRGDDRVRWEAA